MFVQIHATVGQVIAFLAILFLIGVAHADEKQTTSGKQGNAVKPWDSVIAPLPKHNMRITATGKNDSAMNYARQLNTRTNQGGTLRDFLPDIFVGDLILLRSNDGDYEECSTVVEPGKGLFFKKLISITTGGAGLLYHGLSPRGADLVTTCHVVNGVRRAIPVAWTYRHFSIFGAESVNPAVNALRLRLLARPSIGLGEPGKFYLAAAFQGQFFFYSNSTRSWTPLQGGTPLPIWFEATIQAFETQTAIANLDISGLPGLQFWMGYGRNESEHLSAHSPC